MKITRKRLKQLINESIAELEEKKKDDVDEAHCPGKKDDDVEESNCGKRNDEGKKLDVGPVNEDELDEDDVHRLGGMEKKRSYGNLEKIGRDIQRQAGIGIAQRAAERNKKSGLKKELNQGDESSEIDLEEYDDFTGQMKGGGKITDIYENFDLRQFVGDVIYSLLNEQDESLDEQEESMDEQWKKPIRDISKKGREKEKGSFKKPIRDISKKGREKEKGSFRKADNKQEESLERALGLD